MNFSNYMENYPSKIDYKQIRTSASQINLKQQYNNKDLVYLINILNSDIKTFYTSLKQCLNEGKENLNNNKKSQLKILNLIEENLNNFIHKAKATFKKMKFTQKIFCINQEMYNKKNKGNNLSDNFVYEDEEIPSLYNETCSSIKVNNYLDNYNEDIIQNLNRNKYSNNKFKYPNKITKFNAYNLNNTFNNKVPMKNYIYVTKNNRNNNNYTNIIYQNYREQTQKSKNAKSVHNLRKGILLYKNYSQNNSLGGWYKPRYFSHNHSLANLTINKRELSKSFYNILNKLKELKNYDGYIKTWEAEKHKKSINIIYHELNKLVRYMFKGSNSEFNSGNVSDRSSSKKRNNKGYNLTYNYKSFQGKNNDEDGNNFSDYDYKYLKMKIFYDKEIKTRELIIKKLKEELNLKSKVIHIQNLKKNNIYNKMALKDNYNMNNNICVDSEELAETKKVINDMRENFKKYEKSNIEKNYEIMKKKFFDLKKLSDKITKDNNNYKKQINKLYNILKNKESKEKKDIIQNIIQNIESFSVVGLPDQNFISEEAQKIIDDLKNEIQTKINDINKISEDFNILKEEDEKLKEEFTKLNNEFNAQKEEIINIQKENQILKENNINIENEKKNLQDKIDKQNLNIEKCKNIITYQEDELNSFKKNNPNKKDYFINDRDKNNNKRNNSKQFDKYQIEQDKIVLKYELFKNDYEKLNTTLIQKQKLLDNYSKLSNETSSKTNIDEQILELISQHKKEIDNLKKSYNENIKNLKMNLPLGFAPETHIILVDKRYSKYNLRWFLLTVITAEEKDYENTFWVPEEEIKPMLGEFNTFKTEKELEAEQFESVYLTQQKWIKQIDENEKVISKLKEKLQKYEGNSQI